MKFDKSNTTPKSGQGSIYESFKHKLRELTECRASLDILEYKNRRKKLIEEIKIAHLSNEITTAQMSHLKVLIDRNFNL